MSKSQSALRHAQWSEAKIHYEHGRSPVTYVYRGAKPHATPNEPWLVVAQSALLKRLGVTGWGLYAARPFAEGGYIGKFGGTVVGNYPSRQAAMAAPEARRLLRRGHDKLVTVRAAKGVDLLDAHGPPHLGMANDPRGTRLQPNAIVTDAGWMRTTRRVPAFSLGKTVEQNGEAEIRWSYGEDYWDLHALLGTDAAHAIVVDL